MFVPPVVSPLPDQLSTQAYPSPGRNFMPAASDRVQYSAPGSVLSPGFSRQSLQSTQPRAASTQLTQHQTSQGPIWAYMGPYEPIWGPYGPIWAHIGPYGPIWALMGTYGPIWALMGPPGQVLEKESTFRQLSLRLLDQFRTFRVKKLYFDEFLMILYHFCWRSSKSSYFN